MRLTLEKAVQWVEKAREKSQDNAEQMFCALAKHFKLEGDELNRFAVSCKIMVAKPKEQSATITQMGEGHKVDLYSSF